MRLSDAIAVGRTLVGNCVIGGSSAKGAHPGDGCVLDMAALAIGKQNWKQVDEVWPWLNSPYEKSKRGVNYFREIYGRFDFDVMRAKTMTLDQLIDWVRSVEPAEVEEVQATEPIHANETQVIR